jgi:hypothetical protein
VVSTFSAVVTFTGEGSPSRVLEVSGERSGLFTVHELAHVADEFESAEGKPSPLDRGDGYTVVTPLRVEEPATGLRCSACGNTSQFVVEYSSTFLVSGRAGDAYERDGLLEESTRVSGCWRCGSESVESVTHECCRHEYESGCSCCMSECEVWA